MPIYEYQCESCADRFEVKQSMKDDPITTCPRCGKGVQRLISSPAIMFKGSGWYVTDYSDKMKPSSDSEEPAPKTTEKKRQRPARLIRQRLRLLPLQLLRPRPRRQALPRAQRRAQRRPRHRRLPPRNSQRNRAALAHACGLGRGFLLRRCLLRDFCGWLGCARLRRGNFR